MLTDMETLKNYCSEKKNVSGKGVDCILAGSRRRISRSLFTSEFFFYNF